ncbi:MAG TPA: polysaccharide deacetylase [Bryobacteraceae bacterium]|nr:polysaccharide deacetylase [Bryobacteraceae bacterium]
MNAYARFAGLLILILPFRMAAQPSPQFSMPGLNLSLDELRAQYTHLGAGKRLKPRQWPNGARVAVALSFDVDNATVPLSRGQLGSEDLSRGMYGAIDGLPRILRLLDRQNVPASFFIPAVSAALNPEMIPAILARKRHEIGVHGWIHEHLGVLNDESQERKLLDQSIALLTKAVGKRPVGYRAPSWAMSRFTMQQVKEAGFLYDSSLMASDDAYEITLDGRPSGVIELPIERILDDAPYYGAASGSLPSPELVDQIYRAEFDVAYQEGGLYVLTMHPHYTGHRSRALWLEKLIVYMKSKPGVWFATHEEVARYLKKTAWTR